jgi:glycosyltransferase involved in cell wall biosynthesis
MSKNILELCLSPDLGGLELFMTTCYKYFKERTNCHLVVQEDKKLDNYLKDEDKFYLKRNKLLPIIPALKLAKFIDDKNIDIIHFHWTKDISLVVLGKLLSKRKPEIIQTRNMTMTRFKDDFYHKWLYNNINKMHAVTYQVKDQIEKFVPKEICPTVHMVYMGTEANNIDLAKVQSLKEKHNINDNTFIVGIVGRIEEGKGQYLVIDAIKKLINLNIKAVIVGHTMDEDYLLQLKQKVQNLGLDSKVIFTGFTKDVNEHMQLFDVNILATPKETFGLVVIEAMINKVCMIATNKGGPLEIIQDKHDGLLFNRTSEDLSAKIKTLYDNKELKESISQNAYTKAKEKFDKNTQLEELYKKLFYI